MTPDEMPNPWDTLPPDGSPESYWPKELAAARQYIGNDGGIAHLAAAAGCKTAVIFGPEDPRVWAPRGEHVTVIRGIPWPDVDDVLYLVE